jgi:hypothetical protein
MRWSREHPMLILATSVFLVFVIASVVSNDTSLQDASNCQPSQRVEVNGRFVCQTPAQATQQAASVSAAVAPAKAAYPPVSEKLAPAMPIVFVSGAFVGTVHNQTVNLSSTFTVVMHEAKTGVLDGCMEVKPPLYGNGVLRGGVHGSHVDFVVADIRFQGEVSKTGIAGSYVVTRQEGNQLGDFRLTKQTETTKSSYGCSDGAVVEFEIANTSPKPKPVVKTPAATFAVVTGRYGATIYKRCAFLPLENYGRCDYGPEEVAQLKQGDRVRVLSSLTRAQSGDDIYKVRSQQGWEGWARAEDLSLEPQ